MTNQDVLTTATKEALRSKATALFLGSADEYTKKFEAHQHLARILAMDNDALEDWNTVLLKTETMGELRASNVQSRGNMLLPFFRQGDAMLLYAPAGVGKSFLSMCIGLAVAGSGTIKGLDWYSEVKRKVLLVDGEMPRADLRDRLETIVSDEWIDGLDAETAGENFTLLTRLGQDGEGGFIDLTKESSHGLIGQYCVKNEVKLVILDNFSTLTDAMEEENNATAFRQLNLFVSKLKRRGISVLLVHHANKEGLSFRGSSALAVPYDSILGMHKVPTQSANGSPFRLAFEKLRTLQSKATQTRELVMGPFGYSSREGIEADENLTKVVQYIKGNATGETLSIHMVAKAVDLARGMVEKKIARALDHGLLGADLVMTSFGKLPEIVLAALARPNRGAANGQPEF